MNAQVEIARVKPAKTAPVTADAVMLTSVQAVAVRKVEQMLAVTPIVALAGAAGSGRTTLLKLLAEKHNGKLISASDVVPVTAARGADVSEAAIGAYILRMLDRAETILIDDFGALFFPTGTTRANYFTRVVLKHICNTVMNSGKRLIVAGAIPNQYQSPADLYGNEAAMIAIADTSSVDYAVFAQNILGEKKAAGIDFKLVYRFASMLNGHQLAMACGLVANEKAPTADSFIDALQRHNIVAANTRIEQVEALSFDSLPGCEDIVSKLETHIVLPLENRLLAQKLGLKPKRGVLLYGPPGTGKTSIGRALAHRMKGKFFLIDGSFVSEPPAAFFGKLAKVVEEAKQNSPSVLFIDDADVLFKIEHIAGLARYLLSLLDGLESETASNVCVMMTAMDVKKIPEALLRSGRVELWLETKPPTEETRGRILERWMGTELPDYQSIDYSALAKVTEGFTPADLRRIAGDAKALYAADQVNKRKVATGSEYVKRAVNNIVAVRSRMADSLGDESLRVGEDRKKGKYGMGVGGTAQTGTCGSECGW